MVRYLEHGGMERRGAHREGRFRRRLDIAGEEELHVLVRDAEDHRRVIQEHLGSGLQRRQRPDHFHKHACPEVDHRPRRRDTHGDAARLRLGHQGAAKRRSVVQGGDEQRPDAEAVEQREEAVDVVGVWVRGDHDVDRPAPREGGGQFPNQGRAVWAAIDQQGAAGRRAGEDRIALAHVQQVDAEIVRSAFRYGRPHDQVGRDQHTGGKERQRAIQRGQAPPRRPPPGERGPVEPEGQRGERAVQKDGVLQAEAVDLGRSEGEAGERLGHRHETTRGEATP